MALTPQGGHIVRFVRREHSGPKVVYPQFLGNSGGGAGAVPGEHDGVFHAQAPQGGEHVLRLLPHGVGDAEHGGEHPVNGQIQLRELRGQCVELLLLSLRDGHLFIFKDEVGAADAYLLPIHRTSDAVSHQVFHLRMAFLMVQAAAAGLLHHGVGHGVGEVLLQAGGQTEHLRLLHAIEGNDPGHPGAGVGEGAGLVKDDGIRFCHRLQEFTALDSDVLPSRLPHGGEHRQGHGQLQGAGEVHHEHRQGPGHVPGEGQAQQAPGEGVGHQLVRQAGCLGLGGGLHLLGPLDHLHDLVVATLAGDLFYLQDALALLHHGSGVHRAAGMLGHRDGLAGEGCLVDGDLPFRHHAVQGDNAPGPDHHPVAGPDLSDWGKHLAGLSFQPHPIHMEGQAFRQVGHGLLPRPILQQLADLQQEHDGAGGSKVPAACGDADGQGVQQFHLDFSPPQASNAFVKEWYHVPDHPGDPQRGRQKQGGGPLHQHLAHQFFLKLPVQFPGAVAGKGNRFLRPGPGEAADSG